MTEASILALLDFKINLMHLGWALREFLAKMSNQFNKKLYSSEKLLNVWSRVLYYYLKS